MRRLRAGLVTSHPGGPGSPSVPTTRDCPQGLDAARTKAGESLPDRVSESRPGPRPEATVPGTEIAAMERREGVRPSPRTRTPQGVS